MELLKWDFFHASWGPDFLRIWKGATRGSGISDYLNISRGVLCHYAMNTHFKMVRGEDYEMGTP